jgi:plasmid stabilization system protein ParE
MKYRVEFADQAKSDLFEIHAWIAADSAANAARWVSNLEVAIGGLDTSPERCPIAPENEEIDEFDVRHLIVGQYRVLFTVHERSVIVLHIRHASRRTAAGEQLGGPPDWASTPDAE